MFDFLLKLLARLIAQPQPIPPPMPETTPPPVTPPPSPSSAPTSAFPPKIVAWAKAIQNAEGWAPQYPSYKNHNPGNMAFSSLTKSWGATQGTKKADGGYFACFPTYQDGFDSLCKFLVYGAKNQLKDFHQARTLRLFSNVYGNTANDGYALGIAKELGVPVDVLVSSFIS